MGILASVVYKSRSVLCSEAMEAIRCSYMSTVEISSGRTTPTWSSALLAFNMAISMSRSPSPLDLYAPRISLRLGGGGCK